MFEYRWQLGDQQHQQAVLTIGSRRGWFGRKVLTCCGERVFRRGWFEGIEARFAAPCCDGMLHLRMIKVDGTATWRPALLDDGGELPEITGNPPPYVPARPPVISAVTGTIYLAMLIAAIMLPSTAKMLSAVKLPHAERKMVMTVIDPAAGPNAVAVEPLEAPAAEQGEEFAATLAASGGTPPYTWQPNRKAWPKGMTLDSSTGEVRFTPSNPHDVAAQVTVTDARGRSAEGALAIVVRGDAQVNPDWPKITTQYLPPAILGETYDQQLSAVGGKPPYRWSKLEGRFPSGVKLLADTGGITGIAATNILFDLPAEFAAQLKEGAIAPTVRRAFEANRIVLSEGAEVVMARAGVIWQVADDAGHYTIASTKGLLRVYHAIGQYPITLRVEDSGYAVTDDIYPWIVPYAVTAGCLLGFWNMRRWGVYALAVLILLQLLLAFEGSIPIAATALVLQVLLCAVGFAYLRQMA